MLSHSRRGFIITEIVVVAALVIGLVAGTLAVSDRTQKFLTSKKAGGGPGSGCWGSWDCDGNSYCTGASGQPGQPSAKMGVCVAGENKPRTEEQIVQEIKDQNIASEVVQKTLDTLQSIIAQKPKEEATPLPAAQPNSSDNCSFCGGLGQGACDQSPPNYCAFGCKSPLSFCKLTGSCLPAAECRDAAGNLQTDVGPASSNPQVYTEVKQTAQQHTADTLIKGTPQDQKALCQAEGCPDCSTPEKIAACLTRDFTDENKNIVTAALAVKPSVTTPIDPQKELDLVNKIVSGQYSQRDCPNCEEEQLTIKVLTQTLNQLSPQAQRLAKILRAATGNASGYEMESFNLTAAEQNAAVILRQAQDKLINNNLNNPDQIFLDASAVTSQTAASLKQILGDTPVATALIGNLSQNLSARAAAINYQNAVKKLPAVMDTDKVNQLAAEYGLSDESTKQLQQAGIQYAAAIKEAKLAAEAQQKITSAAINLANPLAFGGSSDEIRDQKNEILANLNSDDKKKAENLAANISAYLACRTNTCNDQLAPLSQSGFSSGYLNYLKKSRDQAVASDLINQTARVAQQSHIRDVYYQEDALNKTVSALTPDQKQVYDTAIKSDQLLNIIVFGSDVEIIARCQKAAIEKSKECTDPKSARQILIDSAPSDQKPFLAQINSQIIETENQADLDSRVIDKGISTNTYGGQYQTTVQCQGDQLVTTVTQVRAGSADPVQSKPTVNSSTCPFGCSAGQCYIDRLRHDTSVKTELAFLEKQCQSEKKSDCSNETLIPFAIALVNKPGYQPQLSSSVIQTINTASLDNSVKNVAVETKYQELLAGKNHPCGKFGPCSPLGFLTDNQLHQRAEQYVTQAQAQSTQLTPGFTNQQSFDYLLNAAKTQGAKLDPKFATLSKIPIVSIFAGFYDALFNQGKNVVPVIFNKAPQLFLAVSIRGLDPNLISGFISAGSTYGDPRNSFFQAREIQEIALPACGIPANAPELSDLQKMCLQAQVNALKFKWANIETQNRQNAALQIGSTALGLLTGGASRVLELSTKAVIATNVSLDIANAVTYANISTQSDFDYARALQIQADSAPAGSPQQASLQEQAAAAQISAEQTRNANILTGLVLSGVTNFGGYKLGAFIQGPVRETASQNPFAKAVYNALFDLKAFKPTDDLGEGFYWGVGENFYSFRRTASEINSGSGFLEKEGILFVNQNGQARPFSVNDPKTLFASSVPNGSVFITGSAIYQKTGKGFIRYEMQHIIPVTDPKFLLPERISINDPNIVDGEIIPNADVLSVTNEVNTRLLTEAGYTVSSRVQLDPNTPITYQTARGESIFGTLATIPSSSPPRVITVQSTQEVFLYPGLERLVPSTTPTRASPVALLGPADIALATKPVESMADKFRRLTRQQPVAPQPKPAAQEKPAAPITETHDQTIVPLLDNLRFLPITNFIADQVRPPQITTEVSGEVKLTAVNLGNKVKVAVIEGSETTTYFITKDQGVPIEQNMYLVLTSSNHLEVYQAQPTILPDETFSVAVFKPGTTVTVGNEQYQLHKDDLIQVNELNPRQVTATGIEYKSRHSPGTQREYSIKLIKRGTNQEVSASATITLESRTKPGKTALAEIKIRDIKIPLNQAQKRSAIITAIKDAQNDVLLDISNDTRAATRINSLIKDGTVTLNEAVAIVKTSPFPPSQKNQLIQQLTNLYEISGPGITAHQVIFNPGTGEVHELGGQKITNLPPSVVLDDGETPLIFQNGKWEKLKEGTGGGGDGMFEEAPLPEALVDELTNIDSFLELSAKKSQKIRSTLPLFFLKNMKPLFAKGGLWVERKENGSIVAQVAFESPETLTLSDPISRWARIEELVHYFHNASNPSLAQDSARENQLNKNYGGISEAPALLDKAQKYATDEIAKFLSRTGLDPIPVPQTPAELAEAIKYSLGDEKPKLSLGQLARINTALDKMGLGKTDKFTGEIETEYQLFSELSSRDSDESLKARAKELYQSLTYRYKERISNLINLESAETIAQIAQAYKNAYVPIERLGYQATRLSTKIENLLDTQVKTALISYFSQPATIEELHLLTNVIIGDLSLDWNQIRLSLKKAELMPPDQAESVRQNVQQQLLAALKTSQNTSLLAEKDRKRTLKFLFMHANDVAVTRSMVEKRLFWFSDDLPADPEARKGLLKNPAFVQAYEDAVIQALQDPELSSLGDVELDPQRFSTDRLEALQKTREALNSSLDNPDVASFYSTIKDMAEYQTGHPGSHLPEELEIDTARGIDEVLAKKGLPLGHIPEESVYTEAKLEAFQKSMEKIKDHGETKLLKHKNDILMEPIAKIIAAQMTGSEKGEIVFPETLMGGYSELLSTKSFSEWINKLWGFVKIAREKKDGDSILAFFQARSIEEQRIIVDRYIAQQTSLSILLAPIDTGLISNPALSPLALLATPYVLRDTVAPLIPSPTFQTFANRLAAAADNIYNPRNWPRAWIDIKNDIQNRHWPWIGVYEISGPGITPRQVRFDPQSGNIYELDDTEITNLPPSVVLDDGETPLIFQNGKWEKLKEGIGGGGEKSFAPSSLRDLTFRTILEWVPVIVIPEYLTINASLELIGGLLSADIQTGNYISKYIWETNWKMLTVLKGRIKGFLPTPKVTEYGVLVGRGNFSNVYSKNGQASVIYRSPTTNQETMKYYSEELRKYESKILPRFYEIIYKNGYPIGIKIELIENSQTLNKFFKTGRKLPLKLIEETVSELSKLQAFGFVHGDLKPENILVQTDKEGNPIRVVLIDILVPGASSHYISSPDKEIEVLRRLLEPQSSNQAKPKPWWLQLLSLFSLAFNLPPPCDGPIYTVRLTDNLTKIAKNCHTTVKDLSQLNPLIDPNQIQAGQTLIIDPSYRPPPTPIPTQNRQLHQEEIQTVAEKYQVPWQYLDAIWGVENSWKIPDYAYCQSQCQNNQSCGPMQITPSTQKYVDKDKSIDICTLEGGMEIASRILLWKKYCVAKSFNPDGSVKELRDPDACTRIYNGDFTGMSLSLDDDIVAVGRYNGNNCTPTSSTVSRWGVNTQGIGYTYCDAVQHIIDGDPLPENMGSQRTKYDPVVQCVNALYAEKDLTARKKVDCSYLDGFENRPDGWWTVLIDSSISPADTANLLPPSSQP